MAGPKVVDEASTVKMIAAFNECQHECDTIQKLVDGAVSQLMHSWGGQASGKYLDSMNEWKAGFSSVETALDRLNEAMVTFAKETNTTEDNAIARGSSWATGLT